MVGRLCNVVTVWCSEVGGRCDGGRVVNWKVTVNINIFTVDIYTKK